MKSHETTNPVSPDPEREARLRRFVGPMIEHDQQVVDFWRDASPAAHAQAMIDLADYATQLSRQTGFTKDPSEVFPGFRIDAEGQARGSR